MSNKGGRLHQKVCIFPLAHKKVFCYFFAERRDFMLKLHPWTDYIIRKGFFLAGTLLAAGIFLLIYAQAEPSHFPVLRNYAEYCTTSAIIVTSAALFGGLFLEDIFRK